MRIDNLCALGLGVVVLCVPFDCAARSVELRQVPKEQPSARNGRELFSEIAKNMRMIHTLDELFDFAAQSKIEVLSPSLLLIELHLYSWKSGPASDVFLGPHGNKRYCLVRRMAEGFSVISANLFGRTCRKTGEVKGAIQIECSMQNSASSWTVLEYSSNGC